MSPEAGYTAAGILARITTRKLIKHFVLPFLLFFCGLTSDRSILGAFEDVIINIFLSFALISVIELMRRTPLELHICASSWAGTLLTAVNKTESLFFLGLLVASNYLAPSGDLFFVLVLDIVLGVCLNYTLSYIAVKND
jgi:hypothetical protein